MKASEALKSLLKRNGVSLAVVVISMLLVAIFIVGGVALKVVHENKRGDTLAIMFLELEQQGARLGNGLAQRRAAVEAEAPELEFVLSGNTLKPVKGEITKSITLASLGLDALPSLPGTTVLALAGRAYVAKVEGGRKLSLWPIALDSLARWPTKESEVTAYVMSREGKLVFASDASLTEATVVSRPLVQGFIASPLMQGQQTFDVEGKTVLGFYHEITGTNLVLFSESRRDAAMDATRQAFRSFAFGVAAVLLVSVLLLQRILSFQTRAIASLTDRVKSLTRHGDVERLSEQGGRTLRTAELGPLADAIEQLVEATAAAATQVVAAAESVASEAS